MASKNINPSNSSHMSKKSYLGTSASKSKGGKIHYSGKSNRNLLKMYNNSSKKSLSKNDYMNFYSTNTKSQNKSSKKNKKSRNSSSRFSPKSHIRDSHSSSSRMRKPKKTDSKYSKGGESYNSILAMLMTANSSGGSGVIP